MKNIIRKSIGAILLSGTLLTGNSLMAQTAMVEQTTTTSAGTISEFSPTTIMIRSEPMASPVSYNYSKETTYVDETGAPVAIEMVKSGLPVTVYYTTVGGQMVASKVIVKKAVVVPAAPAVPVTTVAPVVEKTIKTTTTTTED